MKTYHSVLRFRQDIEPRLKKAILDEYKSDKNAHRFSFDGMAQKYIRIVDWRGGTGKENYKTLRINVSRKDGGTHAFIKCNSPNKKQPPFEYKFPAPHVDVEYTNSPYERRITGAFAVNELRIPIMIKALTEWVKEEWG